MQRIHVAKMQPNERRPMIFVVTLHVSRMRIPQKWLLALMDFGQEGSSLQNRRNFVCVCNFRRVEASAMRTWIARHA